MIRVSTTEYKRDALKLLEQVRVSGEIIQITKRGRLIAQLVLVDEAAPEGVFGLFQEDVTIIGDIVGPIIDATEWSELG